MSGKRKEYDREFRESVFLGYVGGPGAPGEASRLVDGVT